MCMGTVRKVGSAAGVINPWLGAAIGLGSAYLGKRASDRQASAISDASQQAYEAQMAMAKPFTEMATYALPRLKSAIDTYIAPNAGKESQTLKSAHKLNVGDINKSTSRSLESAKRYWTATGNTGRARGEILRAEASGTEAMNKENLNYATSQDEYKTNSENRLINSLSSLAGIGSTGLSTSTNAISTLNSGRINAALTKASGTTGMAEDIGSIGGAILGDYLGTRQFNKLMKLVSAGAAKNTGAAKNASNSIMAQWKKARSGGYF